MLGSTVSPYFIFIFLILLTLNSTKTEEQRSITDKPTEENDREIKINFNLQKSHLDENARTLTVILDIFEEHTPNHKNWSTINSTKEAFDLLITNALDIEVLKTSAKIHTNGTLHKFTRISASVDCPIDLFYYPFDRQICSMKLVADDATFQGHPVQVVIKEGIPLSTSPSFSQLGPYRVTQYSQKPFNYQDELGRFNQTGVSLDLLFLRKCERAFPTFFFPLDALLILQFLSMHLSSRITGIYVSLASFLTMAIWVLIEETVILPELDVRTMLDHHQFTCLSLSFNVLLILIITHFYFQNGEEKCPKNEIERSSTFTDVKLELETIDNGNGNDTRPQENGVYIKANSCERNRKENAGDPEAHILQMGKFRQLFYFKSCKPAKWHLPIVFGIFNIVFWIWILVARFRTLDGFNTL